MITFQEALEKIRKDENYIDAIEAFAVSVLSAAGVGASSIAIGEAVIAGAKALVNGYIIDENPTVTDGRLKQIAADLDAGLSDLHKQENAALDAKFSVTPDKEPQP